MKCPFCGGHDDRVIDSRSSSEGAVIRRRRECQVCHRRYTTYERVEETPRMVVKKDLRREPFSREKILKGLTIACQKRPVSVGQLEDLLDRVEHRVGQDFEQEVPATAVGAIVVGELKKIDKVAYVRFASVYQEYADVEDFLRELTPLVAEPSAIQMPATETTGTDPVVVEREGSADSPSTDTG